MESLTRKQSFFDGPTSMAGAIGDASAQPVISVTIHAGQSHRGYLLNMNKRGVFVALPSGIRPDKIVEIEFVMPNGRERLRVVGEVTWSYIYVGSDGASFPGVGVEFLGVEEDGFDQLERFVSANLDAAASLFEDERLNGRQDRFEAMTEVTAA